MTARGPHAADNPTNDTHQGAILLPIIREFGGSRVTRATVAADLIAVCRRVVTPGSSRYSEFQSKKVALFMLWYAVLSISGPDATVHRTIRPTVEKGDFTGTLIVTRVTFNTIRIDSLSSCLYNLTGKKCEGEFVS